MSSGCYSSEAEVSATPFTLHCFTNQNQYYCSQSIPRTNNTRSLVRSSKPFIRVRDLKKEKENEDEPKEPRQCISDEPQGLLQPMKETSQLFSVVFPMTTAMGVHA